MGFILLSIFAFWFRQVLYTPVSTSSGLFYFKMFCQIYPPLCFSLPGLPTAPSQKALCVQQTDSNLYIFLRAPKGLPGEHPDTSLEQLCRWPKAVGSDGGCSALSCLMGPGSRVLKEEAASTNVCLAGWKSSKQLSIMTRSVQMLPGMSETPRVPLCSCLAKSLSSKMQARKAARARRYLIQRCPL